METIPKPTLTHDPTLVVVLYDGIENSVFESQVLGPLKKIRNTHPSKSIAIISFERTIPHANIINTIKKVGINLIIKLRRPFISKALLIKEIYDLIKHSNVYQKIELQARGPIAGYICLQALKKLPHCLKLIIQARGLLTEEYKYEYQQQTIPNKIIYYIRSQLYYSVEYAVYNINHAKYAIPIVIEAVSEALKEYLIKHFKTPASTITIAHDDIPGHITQAQRLEWRTTIRNTLKLDQNVYIYVYCGSAKPWQCPEEVIKSFMCKYTHNQIIHLIIISQDIEVFEKLIALHNLPPYIYTLLSLPQHEVQKHLCAGDCGIIFRKPHIINWISRPTKALEYQAAGLAIEHNQTVKYLMN